jgi:hypothetical protein
MAVAAGVAKTIMASRANRLRLVMGEAPIKDPHLRGEPMQNADNVGTA